MFSVRREVGNLTRDELLHVSTMSWFHLTVSFDSPVIVNLEAQGNSPEERLLKVGQRVGLPAHSRSGSYFRLADDMSASCAGSRRRSSTRPRGADALRKERPAAKPDLQRDERDHL